jgi:hypothetical protein
MNGIHEVTGSTPVWSTNLLQSNQLLTGRLLHRLHYFSCFSIWRQ